MSIFNQEDFSGGLSLLDSTKIEDNQLVACKNMYYDADGRLKTRRGYTIFSYVPDSALSVNTCEATTDWSVSGDATNLTLDTTNEIRGSGALNFDISAYSSGTSKLTLAAASTIDISSEKGYVGFWVNFPTSYDTDLTSVRFRLGSDSSNYYIWTLTNPSEATDSYIVLNFADATTTGTPVDTAIDFAELEFTTDAGYVGYTDFIIDDIRVYSANNTKPPSSVFSVKNETTEAVTTICTAGTSMYLYNVITSKWEQIDSGLTEFETGSTTKRTRWSFISYKNVIYGVNGLDGYKTWNGTAMTTDAGIKGKYLTYLSGIAFIAGDVDNPSTVSYTAPYPANLAAYGDSIAVGSDEEGPVNGLFPVGNLMIAFKDDKSYYLDVFGTTDVTLAIDSYSGGYSHRCTKNVGNGILYYNGIGVDELSQKSAQIGAQALETKPLSDSIRSAFTAITPPYYNSNCATYIKELTNYYITVDRSADDLPESTYVYSSLVKNAWSEYTLPAAYDYARHENTDGTISNLMCSANSGIIYSIESGFNDNDVAISHEVKTKEWDFGDLTQLKEYSAITITGLKSKGFSLYLDIYMDGDLEGSVPIDDSFVMSDLPVGTIGSDPIGDVALGGGEVTSDNSIDVFPYVCRLYKQVAGRKVQVVVRSESKNAQWSLDKVNINYENLSFDELPTQFKA